ncbi:CBS domain-containing protein [Bacillus sp. AGMB 02131]|uniref:CBS domain-containing protein n=1 Tax=Peribacillus faecalis TaxID=2772559 RepID=A0A927D2Q7_9BACI|nr:CBS and ACT domain-containing protein [Peribacillus faecalis]MBD3110490.1 CBS domain-containing protein [Peribacillus faecalis]
MIAEEIMSKDVITLNSSDTIQTAMRVMRENRIRHIPIVDENNSLIGLVTTQSIRNASPSILYANEQIEDVLDKPLSMIMKTNVVTGHSLDFVEDIAMLFYENKIGCLPILNGRSLVGIISESDLLHTFVKFTGADQPGSHIEVKVTNKSGMLHELAAIFKEKNVNILSILMRPDQTDEKSVIVVLRVKTMNPLNIVSALQTNGFTVLWPKAPEFPL